MKKLTKIKLINWHYFSNETIDIKNDCLITGQNATGKSTIMDAIQYVLTAGEQNFNMAAHDHGNRNLKGYVLCKLGLDNKEFLREGDVSTHVALEFFDDVDSKYWVVGVVLDYKSTNDNIKTTFYSANLPMSDDMFIKDGMVLSHIGMREAKIIVDFYSSKKEAKMAFRSIYGSINERFFTLIQKALAFKPINNVKDFIYQYLLDEKKIDVETIQDSIRMYKDLERVLKSIKKKVADLSEINTIATNIRLKHEKGIVNDLLIKLVGIEELQNKTKRLNHELKKIMSSKEDQLEIIKNLENNIRVYDEKSKVLYSSLMSNDVFKSKEQLQGQIERMKSELNVADSKKQKYLSMIVANNTMLDAYSDRNDFKTYRQLRGLNLKEVDDSNFNDMKSKVMNIENVLESRSTELYEELGQLRINKREISRQYDGIVNIIKSLEGRKIRYNPNVVALRDAINEHFAKNGINSEVGILAEMVEISDYSWQDAIENYLNAQRFTLIVEPAYFDFALDIFDQIKTKRQIYGVGLVNTRKMVGYDTCNENSLANIITSNNPYAKRFINMTLGHVMRAKNTHDLENYSTAITKESVVYHNYTVRQLNINIEKPFMGRDAIAKQMPKYLDKEREMHAEYLNVDSRIRKIEEELNIIGRLNLKGVIDGMASVLAYETQKRLLKELSGRKFETISSSSAALQKEYETISEKLKGLNDELLRAHEELGRIKGEISSLEQEILISENNVLEYQQVFVDIKNENVSLENEVFSIYAEDIKNLSIHDLYIKYNKEQEANSRQITHLEDQLKAEQIKYNNAHNFQGDLGYDNMNHYLAEYDRLVNSHLVEYEDKVRAAREDTERIFKEDFIAKLRSNIIEAQEGVKKINLSLQQIRFGEDTYEFIFPKSKEFSGIYDMVMSDTDETNGPIVTPEFELKYQEELAMLFDTLAIEEINSEGVISKFTDYRTYMDYDIRVTNINNDVSLFSKILKEKSGGETQVPFYVSIVASFVQLYHSSRSSIGLIMFDEAFDKMDSSRIAKMMEFVRPLGLQLLIAATPQKLYPITNYVDTTLIIFRNGRNSYVVPKVNKE